MVNKLVIRIEWRFLMKNLPSSRNVTRDFISKLMYGAKFQMIKYNYNLPKFIKEPTIGGMKLALVWNSTNSFLFSPFVAKKNFSGNINFKGDFFFG